MWALYFVGPELERLLGPVRYLAVSSTSGSSSTGRSGASIPMAPFSIWPLPAITSYIELAPATTMSVE